MALHSIRSKPGIDRNAQRGSNCRCFQLAAAQDQSCKFFPIHVLSRSESIDLPGAEQGSAAVTGRICIGEPSIETEKGQGQ